MNVQTVRPPATTPRRPLPTEAPAAAMSRPAPPVKPVVKPAASGLPTPVRAGLGLVGGGVAGSLVGYGVGLAASALLGPGAIGGAIVAALLIAAAGAVGGAWLGIRAGRG